MFLIVKFDFPIFQRRVAPLGVCHPPCGRVGCLGIRGGPLLNALSFPTTSQPSPRLGSTLPQGLFVKFSGSFRSQFNDKPEGDRVLRGQTPTPAG